MAAQVHAGRTSCQKRRRLIVVALAAIFVVLSPTARAADLSRDGRHGPYLYQGAYWGFQLHTGMVMRAAKRAGNEPGPAYGLSARIASILSIADVQATAMGAHYWAKARDGRRVDVGRWSLGLEAHLHPLMITILKNSTFWYWAAGLYGEIGVDLDLVDLRPRHGPGGTFEPRFGWHIGAGTDFPLTDPNRGWSLWIGLAYHYHFLSVHSGALGLGPFNEHQVIITLGYRNNDIDFAHAPIPPELDYRDPAVPDE